MKKIIKYILYIIVISLLIINNNRIINIISDAFSSEPKVVIPKPNSYYKNASYDFVKQSVKFSPLSQQDVKNIFFSIFDRGYDEFTFYCPKEYKECLEDVEKISNDNSLLTHINNFVSPFNDFSEINVTYTQDGEVNIKIKKLYDNTTIKEVNNKLDSIIEEIITEDMKNEDKILAFHDYVINNTKYDVDKKSTKSNTAYGALIDGYAVCGGYADAMALFLNRLNIPNYKVASDTHVWNALFLENAWIHLDLTWDDPVTENGKDTLLHKFYLIDTASLEKYNITDHEFDKTIYEELS